MFDSAQLHTFLTVAKLHSFSKAANELNVSQSAISQSIKNLEEKVSATLFKRSGKNVQLTLEGERLFHFSNKYLHELSETIDWIRSSKKLTKGEVRIGTLSGVGKSWLCHRLVQLAMKYPDLIVKVELGFYDDLIREFENFNLDFLILPEVALPHSGERLFLSEERCTLVFPKNNPYEVAPNMDLESFAQLPTILFEPKDPLYYRWCKERFGKTPRKINVRYIVNSHSNMLEAVSEGIGVAVIPTHVLKRSHLFSSVGHFGSDLEVKNYSFYIVYHKESGDLQRTKIVIEELLKDGSPLSEGL